MKITDDSRLLLKPCGRRLPRICSAGIFRCRTGALMASVALACCSVRGAAATGITVVHSFSAIETSPPSASVNADGAVPMARMTLATNGNLYGTTTSGGAYGAGIIFEFSTNGTLTDLFDFRGLTTSDGTTNTDLIPNELTPGPRGALYGTTQRGGTNGSGAIFIRSPSGAMGDLYDFSPEGTNVSSSNADGFDPTGALVTGPDGNFYGTTLYGGANGTGTIFQFTSSGVFTSLYSFSALGGALFTANADGANPNGLTLGTDGNFYGTTQAGGANGAGEFFQFTIAGVLTPLYSFGATDRDAANPQAALAQGPNGNFYGTSEFGGSNFSGTIFEATPAGAVTVLYSFAGGNDGGLPSTALTLGSDGNFYGTTAAAGANQNGVFFRVTQAGAFSSLYSFPALNANSKNATGASPSATLTVSRDGNLYGSCATGGSSGTGTIFRYTNAAFISPVQPPLFTSLLPSKTNSLAGTYVTLNMAAKGAPTLTYQWLKNKTNVLTNGGDISGATTSALTIGPLLARDAGSYSVLVTNSFGATNSAATILTVAAETTLPMVKIASPAALARTNSPVLGGTASDVVRVTNVLYWITNENGGPLLKGAAVLTNGGSNWTVPLTPFPGTNVLVVQSVNFSGTNSTKTSQTFFYKVTHSLGLFTDGDGAGRFTNATASVAKDPVPARGAALNIGEGYSIKAVPDSHSLFSNWTGSSALGLFTNTNAVLAFVMESNMVLTANFATNFFLAAHGTYNGLFCNTNAVAVQSSGMIKNLLVATNGIFSGQLWHLGTSYSLGGAFDITGHASNSFGSASAAGGLLKVNLAVDREGRRIVGTVSNTLWTAGLTAEFAGTNLPSAQYTLIFAPPAGAPATTPPGDGYAVATNHLGTVTFTTAALADGTTFTPSSSESPNGDFPVYASLYGNTGLLLGWINLTNLWAGPPSNTLTWIKPASRSYPPYTNGFTNTLGMLGSLWTNTPAKVPSIALTDGQLAVSNNANIDLTFSMTVSNNDVLVKQANGTTNSLTGSIAPKTGVFTVTFGNGAGKSTTSGSGVIIQSQDIGRGFFLGTTNAGLIILGASDVPTANGGLDGLWQTEIHLSGGAFTFGLTSDSDTTTTPPVPSP